MEPPFPGCLAGDPHIRLRHTLQAYVGILSFLLRSRLRIRNPRCRALLHRPPSLKRDNDGAVWVSISRRNLLIAGGAFLYAPRLLADPPKSLLSVPPGKSLGFDV